MSVADPRFSRGGGGTNPRSGSAGKNLIFSLENCMKFRKKLLLGGGGGANACGARNIPEGLCDLFHDSYKKCRTCRQHSELFCTTLVLMTKTKYRWCEVTSQAKHICRHKISHLSNILKSNNTTVSFYENPPMEKLALVGCSDILGC